jgi:hypothetical protein
MESATLRAYKGKEHTKAMEFAVISFSADSIVFKRDGNTILLLDRDGDVQAQISAVGEATFVKVG